MTFHFFFLNFYCRKNSPSIPCFVLNIRDNCIALANQVNDTCPLTPLKRLGVLDLTIPDKGVIAINQWRIEDAQKKGHHSCNYIRLKFIIVVPVAETLQTGYIGSFLHAFINGSK